MTVKIKNRVRAYMTLVGTVIGAGIFGVPFVFARSGVMLGVVYTLLLGALQIILYLMFGEILMRVRGIMRLPGIAAHVLGKRWGGVEAVSSVLGFWASLLAYFLLGGVFLQVLLGSYVHLPQLAWQFIFYGVCSAVVVLGIQAVGKMETVATTGLLFVFFYFLVRLSPHLQFANISFATGQDWFLPYGVILYALSGISAIATVHDMLKKDEGAFQKVIIFGNATAILVTILFGLLVVGVSGIATTDRAIDGLVPFLGSGVLKAGALFGFLGVATSFFSTGLYLRDVFRIDYHVHRSWAALCALGMPVVLYFLGAQQFITVISFSGAVFGAVDTTVIGLTYLTLRRQRKSFKELAYEVVVSPWMTYVIIGIFVVGFALTLFVK